MKFSHIILIVCIFLLAFFAGYIGLEFYKEKSLNNNTQVTNSEYVTRNPVSNDALHAEMLTKINVQETLAGTILLTSVLKESDPTLERINTYAYNVVENTIKKVDTQIPALYPYSNRKTGGHIFASWPEQEKNPSLFEVSSDAKSSTVLTGSSKIGENVMMRLPRVSSDGKEYLFSAQTWKDKSTQPDFADINSWKIFVGTLETPDATSAYFADGYGAQFAGNGKYIVYVKENGVFAKKIVAGADYSLEPETQIISENFKYVLPNQIGISPNGEYIAITYPVFQTLGDSFVDIYKIVFDESSLIKSSAVLVERIVLESPVTPYWPIFSPEGRYLSFQTSKEISPVSSDNKLSIYDLVEKKYVQYFDFNDFDFSVSFNTDWVSEFSQ